MTKLSSLSLRYIRVKEEERHNYVQGNYQTDIEQRVEIEEYHLVVEYSMDRITEIALGIIRTKRMILRKEILERI